MKYCPSCGSELRVGAHFCPACGKSLEERSNQVEDSFAESYPEKERKSGNSFINILLILAICVVCYIGFGILQSGETPVFDPQATLTSCTGTYTDMTGMLTGIKDGKIDVISEGGHLIGKGRTGDFSFDLEAVDEYELVGESDFKAVVTKNRVFYDLEKERLTFTREGSPMDWYIEKER